MTNTAGKYFEIVCLKNDQKYICLVMSEKAERCFGIKDMALYEESFDEMIKKLRSFLSSTSAKEFFFQNIPYTDLDDLLRRIERVVK